MSKKDKLFDRREALEQGARRMNRAAFNRMEDGGIVWYLVFTSSPKEFIAQRVLHHWGGAVYLPLWYKWRRVNRFARQKRRLAYPVLPGCLFMGLAEGEERWLDLFDLRIVRGVLGCDGRPVTIPADQLRRFIQNNRFRFEAPDEERFMRTHGEFRIGDRVQIVEGPFEGHIVDVEAIKGRKAHILMNLLGSIQDIEISLDKLEKAA